MAKYEIKENPRLNQVFDDLDKFLNFCKDYGYSYDERDLYNNKSYTYRQFTKYLAGKQIKDNWSADNQVD